MSPAAKKQRTPSEHDDSPSEYDDDDVADDPLPCEDLSQFTCLEDAEIGRPRWPEVRFTRADEDNIEACADWSYIRYLECAFEAVQAVSAGFQDGRFPLECQVAVRVDAWIHKSFKRVPAAQRQAMGARVLDGVDALLDELYEALMAVYEARAGCCDEELVPSAGPTAALVWKLEHVQHEFHVRGGGAAPHFALRVGRELMQAFRILCSPDLARFLGGGSDVGLPENIDRILGPRWPDGSPRTPAYQLAELAVSTRQAIEQVATLVRPGLTDLTKGEIDGLTARLALQRAVAGRRDFNHKHEKLDDDAAQAAADVIQLARSTPF